MNTFHINDRVKAVRDLTGDWDQGFAFVPSGTPGTIEIAYDDECEVLFDNDVGLCVNSDEITALNSQ